VKDGDVEKNIETAASNKLDSEARARGQFS